MARGQASVGPSAFRGDHEAKPLEFDPVKLKGLSERLIRSHWENNYGGAIKALNAIERRLAAMLPDKGLPPYACADLKREELLRTGSVILHEHYVDNLGGDGRPHGPVVKLLDDWFGGYGAWHAEFPKMANGLAGGSAWAHNLHTGQVHNYWAWDHMHNVPLGWPLLVLDMCEHSYHLDYGPTAAKYVEAFMENVDWDEVNGRWRAVAKTS